MFDEYVKDWKAKFEVGQEVEGRITRSVHLVWLASQKLIVLQYRRRQRPSRDESAPQCVRRKGRGAIRQFGYGGLQGWPTCEGFRQERASIWRLPPH